MRSKQFPRITMLVLLVTSLLLAACGGGSGRQDPAAVTTPQPGGASTGPASGGATINVALQEMTVALDKTQAAAGTITFVVQNNGHAPHDFAIRGSGLDEKIPRLEPGQSATLTVELSPGTYEYECTVPGHAIAGMRGTLTVT